MNDDALLIRKPSASPVARVEIARSFSYKLNCANHGGAQYESHDFFCSEKAECAIEDAEDVSEMLYQFCKSEVRRAVKEHIAEMKNRRVA
jgi:hypothetical protein